MPRPGMPLPLGMFALFCMMNSQMRFLYSKIRPSATTYNTIPGTEEGSNEVEAVHALVATLIFVAALFVNLNAALFSLQTSRFRLNLQVAFISAVSAYTHYQMYVGNDWYVVVQTSHRTVSFSGLRQLEWAFTTPVLLLLVQNVHAFAFAAMPKQQGKKEKIGHGKESMVTGGAGGKLKGSARGSTYAPVNRVKLILVDELMILCGMMIPLSTGVEYVTFMIVAKCCFVYVIYHSVRALLDILWGTDLDLADASRIFAIIGTKIVAWLEYPLIFWLSEFGYIDCKQQHELYLIADVLTKFSYTLLISAGSLRFIEVLDEQRSQQAIQMSHVQRAFFFNITHELRTPLNSIIGFNTLAMESGELTEFTESFIKASLTSAEALLGLINQVLDFAKFEGAKDKSGGSEASIELSEDAFSLRELIEQVTDISQKASSRGVELVIHIANPEHFNTRFIGDFFRLRQCCVNLVDNAIKYSSNVDGRTAMVEFSMKVTTKNDDLSSITFSVEDNGVGIAASKQHTLFVPFCQPADHKVAKEKGTGLGLVITKSIIECMGGEIDFESVEDVGTKFFFKVDFKRAPEKSLDESGGYEEFIAVDTLPGNARAIFHHAIKESTRKHVTSILKCFGGRPGVNYVSVASEDKLTEKIRDASMLGTPLILTDVDNMNDTLATLKKCPKAGVIIFGLPYQLLELHHKVSDMRNVQTVLKPVKPSDFIRAVNKLAAMYQSNDFASAANNPREDDDELGKIKTAVDNAADNSNMVIKGMKVEGDAPQGELKGMSVLLVEDNAMNQQMAKFSIIKCGAELEIAMHGQQAVDMIRERFANNLPNFDCILMDLMMPVMNGAQATIEIREMEKAQGKKPHMIVGLSANVGPEYTEQVKSAGMDGSMSKPFYPATLRNTLFAVFKGTYLGFNRSSGEYLWNSIENAQSKPGN